MLNLSSTVIALNIHAIEHKLTDISSVLTPTHTPHLLQVNNLFNGTQSARVQTPQSATNS